ncbi:MAG: hypothetical protein ACYCPT_00115 [Acidimicrobiales bacterium]
MVPVDFAKVLNNVRGNDYESRAIYSNERTPVRRRPVGQRTHEFI